MHSLNENSIVKKVFNALKVDDLKDARSASLYPYNQSQILQNVKYTK